MPYEVRESCEHFNFNCDGMKKSVYNLLTMGIMEIIGRCDLDKSFSVKVAAPCISAKKLD